MKYKDLAKGEFNFDLSKSYRGGAVIVLSKEEAGKLAEELFYIFYFLPKRGVAQKIYDLLAHVRA